MRNTIARHEHLRIQRFDFIEKKKKNTKLHPPLSRTDTAEASLDNDHFIHLRLTFLFMQQQKVTRKLNSENLVMYQYMKPPVLCNWVKGQVTSTFYFY